MTSGLLSDTYLEAHTVVQITKTDDEIMGSDEITPAELRAIHEDNFYEKLARDQLYKIGLPGKSILEDYFQENMTS